MTVTNFSKARTIPSKATTKKSAPTTTNFAKGIFTYKPNDTMDFDEIYLAQNARFDRIGEYKTRRGIAKLCEPIGKTKTQDTYSGDYTMVAAKDAELSITSADAIYSINLTIATVDAEEYGVAQVLLLDEDEEIVATSCAQNITTTPADTEFVFKDAPSGTFDVKVVTQENGKQSFTIACASGSTPMYQLNTATAGQVTSLFEANIDDVKTILFTFKTEDDVTTLYLSANNNPSV